MRGHYQGFTVCACLGPFGADNSTPPTPPHPQCHATDDSALVSSLSVLFMFSDDCLRSECFLQLPGLARSRQQCSHQSDGRRLRLDHRHLTHLGLKAAAGSQVQGALQVRGWALPGVSPEGTVLAPLRSSPGLSSNTLKESGPFLWLGQGGTCVGCKDPRPRPPPHLHYSAGGDGGYRALSLLSLEDFSVQGRGPASPALNTLTRTPDLHPRPP